MAKIKETLISKNFLSLALLFILSALFYLPLVSKLGYTHDDWYLMYSAKVKGISIFHTIFSEDRPLRAFVMMPAYWLFGENPLYYNLASYIFRLLGGISFLWALRLVWVKEKLPTFVMVLLFLVYPGFLSHPNGIDYLSHLVALAFAPLSIALSLKAVLTTNRWHRTLFYSLSVFLGWIYLGLMEYYIGIESLRFLLIFVILWRREGTWLQKVWRTVWQSLPFLLASIPFLIWRLFLFESERGATDTGKQLAGFLSDPVQSLLHWGKNLAEDFTKVLFGAWTIPLSQFYNIHPALLRGMSILFLALVLWGIYALFFAKKKGAVWQREALFVGVISLFICQIPVVLVNRQVSFPVYSRYTLPGSLGAVMIIVALVYSIRLKYLKETVFVLLLLISGLTHHANAAKFAAETKSMNDYWWQVSWRVPHFGERTTLVVNYPRVNTEEDYFIWGPANQIYFPEGTSEKVVQPGVYAVVLNGDAIEKIQSRERQEYSNRRGIETYPNYRNILILTQPTLNSCVQVIDGFQPEYSEWEVERIMRVGEYSEIEHILTEATSHTPPEIVFGPEPAHDWCYIYQKATLARQRGDWELVYALDTEASQKGSAPKDSIEWMPFLQASAIMGDSTRLEEIAPSMMGNPFITQQVCQILTGMELSPEMSTLSEDLFCLAK